MSGPTLRATSVTIGCSHPRDLARFYAGLLDWPVTADEPPASGEPDHGGWAQVRPPDGTGGPTLNFEYERHFTRPEWPSRPGRQTASQHLDIHTDDLPAAVDRAMAHGATLARFQPQPDVRVLFDPDGHPFCLFT